jgi:hypothetical protein
MHSKQTEQRPARMRRTISGPLAEATGLHSRSGKVNRARSRKSASVRASLSFRAWGEVPGGDDRWPDRACKPDGSKLADLSRRRPPFEGTADRRQRQGGFLGLITQVTGKSDLILPQGESHHPPRRPERSQGRGGGGRAQMSQNIDHDLGIGEEGQDHHGHGLAGQKHLGQASESTGSTHRSNGAQGVRPRDQYSPGSFAISAAVNTGPSLQT